MTVETREGGRPRISIVMIAYNVERWIAEALDSVLMQKVDADYEVVVGEDCSTDRTRAIVLDYARHHPQRIRLILRERNLGMNRNFMETLLAADGDYVALLDADDYWTTPHKLQRQLDFLRAHPECSICFHNAMVVYEDQDVASHPFHMAEPQHLISHYIPKPISTLDDLAGGNFMQTCSVIFRNGLYRPLPDWYLSMPTFDWPLHLLNAEHGTIGYLDEVMGAYRVHKTGFWSMNMAYYRRIEDVELMIGAYEIVNRYTGYRFDRKIQGQVRPLFHRAAEVLIGNGAWLRASRYALKALREAPREEVAYRKRSLKLLLRSLGRAVTR